MKWDGSQVGEVMGTKFKRLAVTTDCRGLWTDITVGRGYDTHGLQRATQTWKVRGVLRNDGTWQYPPRRTMSDSEALVQQRVRIACSQRGWRVWRNNVGVLRDERGVPVRYGLANESSAMNQQYKSSDLIGIRPVVITQDMVGTTIGQFVSLEVKHEGWHYTGTPREVAQARWIDMVRSLGGVAGFTTGEIEE